MEGKGEDTSGNGALCNLWPKIQKAIRVANIPEGSSLREIVDFIRCYDEIDAPRMVKRYVEFAVYRRALQPRRGTDGQFRFSLADCLEENALPKQVKPIECYTQRPSLLKRCVNDTKPREPEKATIFHLTNAKPKNCAPSPPTSQDSTRIKARSFHQDKKPEVEKLPKAKSPDRSVRKLHNDGPPSPQESPQIKSRSWHGNQQKAKATAERTPRWKTVNSYGNTRRRASITEFGRWSRKQTASSRALKPPTNPRATKSPPRSRSTSTQKAAPARKTRIEVEVNTFPEIVETIRDAMNRGNVRVEVFVEPRESQRIMSYVFRHEPRHCSSQNQQNTEKLEPRWI